MLPLNLLRVRFAKGGRIKPKYIDELEEYIVADAIAAFKQGVGRKLGDAVKAAEDLGGDPRLIKGLVHLLRQRVVLEDVNEAEVIRMRLDAFREAAKLHPVTLDNRHSILNRVAEKFGTTPDQVDNVLLKIYDDERIIIDFKEPEPSELRREYDLSLAQTLLFKAMDIEVEVNLSGTRAKTLLRQAKAMGLMYMAENSENGIKLLLDGPVSIIKQIDRYGTRLAKLLPLLAGTRWNLRARIKMGDRIYDYEDSSEETDFPESIPILGGELFDSAIEADFYRRLSSICGEVKREPEPLVVDGKVFIPDFKVGNAYVELVGYWTPQYLRRKYEKLMKLNIPIIVLVDEKLATSAWRELPHFVVMYKDRPRVTDIYKLIRIYCRRS